MLITEQDISPETIRTVAKQMLVAARTAPKARGTDNLYLALAEGDTLKQLSKKMLELGEKHQHPTFIRDAAGIDKAMIVVLIGTAISSLGLKTCGLCGFANCQEREQKQAGTPCVFNTGDMGIAVGSAVSVAMEARVDNRIMYSAGYAARELGILPSEIKIVYAIPLAVSAKNPFFDR